MHKPILAGVASSVSQILLEEAFFLFVKKDALKLNEEYI